MWWINKRGQTCLIAFSMVLLLLFMTVLYSSSSNQHPSSPNLKPDYQLLGRPLFKLDLSWPRNPELFTGQVFAVAVNQYTGVVYVAQRGKDILDLVHLKLTETPFAIRKEKRCGLRMHD